MFKFNEIKTMSDEVAFKYEKFSDLCLNDNSYFQEEERISIHDEIWHKVMILLWTLNFKERNDENLNLVKNLSIEVSSVLDNLIEKIKVVLV